VARLPQGSILGIDPSQSMIDFAVSHCLQGRVCMCSPETAVLRGKISTVLRHLGMFSSKLLNGSLWPDRYPLLGRRAATVQERIHARPSVQPPGN
jgi:hypothetical protein